MKRLLMLAMLMAGLTSTLLAAEPLAPKAAIPAGMEESYLAEAIRQAEIPETDQVGIPIYPGAVVIRSYAVAERPENYTGLPIVELISVDDYDAVVAFYKKNLPGWGEAELMSAYYFAEHGNIKAEREMLQRVLPGAKTLIKVFYSNR